MTKFKMGTTLVKIMRLFFFVAVSCLIFTTCEVGLGSSVDTESPEVAVTYPPANAAVRGTFVLAGTCSDDKNVASVSVTLTNTTMSKSFGPYTEKFDTKTEITSWSMSLNKTSTTNAAYYNGWELPDGKYTVTYFATDTSGRTSGGSTYAIEIDNTAPVFILKSPASIDKDNPTSYGANFKINGTIAEDHTVKTMAVTIYAAYVQRNSIVEV